MERHRFNVCIERRDDNGIWSINSNDNFDTIIEARTVNDAERMLMSQYGHGGNTVVRTNYRGQA
jgi:hypothetical protein